MNKKAQFSNLNFYKGCNLIFLFNYQRNNFMALCCYYNLPNFKTKAFHFPGALFVVLVLLLLVQRGKLISLGGLRSKAMRLKLLPNFSHKTW